MTRLGKPENDSSEQATDSGGSHRTDTIMPSEVALELALRRRAEARARDKDDPSPGGKRHRRFGRR